jgi:EmrB/QacA subfamily drug resistance transporter
MSETTTDMTAPTRSTSIAAAGSSAPEALPRRWLALVFIALAQLMVALDATIVNIALPSAQASLHASDASRQWVITGYTVAFGGLLLLGGRIADWLGRKRTLLAGLAGFAAASALGGAATSFELLVAARALQGAFAALLTPTALSLLAVTFTAPRERATAFAVYGSIAGSGGAIGLLLGGALTQFLTWRWCLYVNLPIAVVAAAGAWRLLPGGGGSTRGGRFDLAGVVLGTGGLVAVIFACTQAVSLGWSSPTVVGLLAGGFALLAGFVVRERSAANPLLPLRVVLDRTRGGMYLAVLLSLAGLLGAFLFITYYLQVVLHYSPLEAGLAFLPITVSSQMGSWLVARRLMPQVPPRALVVPGLLVAAAGVGLLTQLQPDGTSYFTTVLPAELLLGAGIATAMVTAFSNATLGVERALTGVASAAVNAAQQIGASVGVALLNSVAAAATVAYLATHHAQHNPASALVHGFTIATGWAALILVAGAVVAALLINAPAPAHRAHEAGG